ncbi:ATP-binding protein [Streptacidiphilus jiangxiensis]|uniref:Histidine kinase/HSP90-like ATPase domain-containing protein n=1 Tax=Streptacidiphilus jiangxiensis TaxID=235985 RepID=A0A1H8BK65_STRJI|nr:ATP-binding protein [Streptacidiphilus jiangxiensis]SEM83281.1 hypothetical protein SAMN05414137_1695 [Streptacidiphilus jiangxiensis]
MPAANSESNQPGWYLVPTSPGFRLHLCVTAAAIAAVRRQVEDALREIAHPDTIAIVQLLMTELLTNALDACGSDAPVVVVLHASTTYIDLDVHDPDSSSLPAADTGMPDEWAVSGRGLPLVEALSTPPVRAEVTSLGKQIGCRIPNPAA